jgi:hypothetical protein
MIGCCTTGFAAATLWFDYDTSAAKRKESPKLAGVTPDSSRGPFFFLLVISSALQVLARSLASALLIIVDKNYFLAHLLCDHAFYQIYLVIRGDHQFMLPSSNSALSIVQRFMEKIIADYTSR